MNDEILYLDLRAKDCVADAFFNGVPVARAGHGEPLRMSVPVEHHAVEGTNRLEILLGRGESEATSSNEDERPPKVVCRLVFFRDGDNADSDAFGRTIAEVILGRVEDWNRTHTADVVPHITGARPSWLDAETLTVTSELERDVERVIAELGRALAEGDQAALTTLFGAYVDDYARAYPQMGRAGVLETLRRLALYGRDGGARLAAPEPSAWQLRLAARGKVLDLRRKDGGPLLSLVDAEGVETPYPAMLARRGGAFWVLR